MSTRQQTFLVPMIQPNRPIYLDCAATTPIDPRVRDVVLHYMDVEFGNAGSRTHVYGQEAAKGVKKAREQVAAVVDARPEDVIFTSGATEANNLAILGLAEYGKQAGKRHIISTEIEHKAVLEPLEHLANNGFEIELVAPTEGGFVDPDEIACRLRSDTLLVTVMHVNNETGVIQPIVELSNILKRHSAVFFVDAAQGFCKDLEQLKSNRIDMISLSGHKIFGPKGIGCLVLPSGRKELRSLQPLFYGGGQERGLRPGTLPVALAAGMGLAAEILSEENVRWAGACSKIDATLKRSLTKAGAQVNGDQDRKLPNILNFSIPGIDSEIILLQLKNTISIANGSACTSDKMESSHVMRAMFPNSERADWCCRMSWDHLSDPPPYDEISEALIQLMS